MELNGREVGFWGSVMANRRVAEICPNKDMSKFKQLVSGDTVTSIEASVKLVCILSEAYEEHMKRLDKSYVKRPITADELYDLPVGRLAEFTDAAAEALLEGSKTTIETEAPKGKNGDTASE